MEKSEKFNYDESDDPTINVNQQGNFVQPPSYTPFDNSGFHQNDFNQRPNFGPLPPQQPVNTFPTFVPHQPDPRDSYCGRLHRNRRQAASVSGGKHIETDKVHTKTIAALIHIFYRFFVYTLNFYVK